MLLLLDIQQIREIKPESNFGSGLKLIFKKHFIYTINEVLHPMFNVVCKGKNNRKTAGGYKWKYYEES